MATINRKVILAMSAVAFALCFGMATADVSQSGVSNNSMPNELNADKIIPTGQPDVKDASNMTIVEIFSDNPSFSTLAQALNSADLINVLAGTGPFTVFAPNDEAFLKLPPQTLQNLLKPENKDKLAALLTYHVVPGKLPIADLKDMDIKTVNGKTLHVKVDGDQVQINGAKVIQKNMVGTNGVIYTIDSVLIP